MSAKRAAGILGGALLLAAWLSSAAGLMRQAPEAALPAERERPDDTVTLAEEVQAQTLRLKNRLASAPTPHEPFRNPFAFSSRTAPERKEAAPPAAEEARAGARASARAGHRTDWYRRKRNSEGPRAHRDHLGLER